jgi:hypothetical protein
MFFFEKKNQKTFDCFGCGSSRIERALIRRSFLVLFFKKELLSAMWPSLGACRPVHRGSYQKTFDAQGASFATSRLQKKLFLRSLRMIG